MWTESIEPTMDWVAQRLARIEQCGLYIEIIVWAVSAVKENPSLSIEEAIEIACEEWDV